MTTDEYDKELVSLRTHAVELGRSAGNLIANIANIPGWDHLTAPQKVERAHQNIATAESEMRRLREIGQELLTLIKAGPTGLMSNMRRKQRCANDTAASGTGQTAAGGGEARVSWRA